MSKLYLSSDHNKGLDDLLFLDGSIIVQEHGCWVKIEAKRSKQLSIRRPHGIRYSLSLHAQNGKRVLGYDNAHPIKEKKGKYATIKYSAYDHKHESERDKGQPYHFVSAQQLMVDFWSDVDKTLRKHLEKMQ